MFKKKWEENRVKADDHLKAYHLYLQGKTALGCNKPETALKFFLQSAELDAHFKTFEQMYYCFICLKKEDSALEAIKKAYYQNPCNDKVAYLYACQLKKHGDALLSRKIANEVNRRNPSYRPQEIKRLME